MGIEPVSLETVLVIHHWPVTAKLLDENLVAQALCGPSVLLGRRKSDG